MTAQRKDRKASKLAVFAVRRAEAISGVVATDRDRVAKGPLSPFTIIDGSGMLHRAGRLASNDKGPWRSFWIHGAVCLYPRMVLVSGNNEIIQETVVGAEALAASLQLPKPRGDAIDVIRKGGTLQASIEPVEHFDGRAFLPSSAPRSYFHWLLEYLPNIALWRALGRRGRIFCRGLIRDFNSSP